MIIIKLTATEKNEPIYVNFDYVHTMRKDGQSTELIMSADKYSKLRVKETPEDIYDMLYPAALQTESKTAHCSGNCHCHDTEVASNSNNSVEEATAKKPATKKPKTTTEVAE